MGKIALCEEGPGVVGTVPRPALRPADRGAIVLK